VRLFNPAVFNGPELFNTGAEDPGVPPSGGRPIRQPITLTIPFDPHPDDETVALLIALLRHRLRV
jgi:hypothetical protein